MKGRYWALIAVAGLWVISAFVTFVPCTWWTLPIGPLLFGGWIFCIFQVNEETAFGRGF